MPGKDGQSQYICGREAIDPLHAFFDEPWVQSYMDGRMLSRERFPRIVLQQSHGDHVAKLPADAVLLASSTSCEVEMYTVRPGRLLAFQSHPEFNASFQQEMSSMESLQFGDMWDVLAGFKRSKFLAIQDTTKGPETRNLVLGIIMEFVHCR